LGKPILTLASDRLPPSESPEDIVSGPIVSFDPQSPDRAIEEVVGRLAQGRFASRTIFPVSSEPIDRRGRRRPIFDRALSTRPGKSWQSQIESGKNPPTITIAKM